MFARSFFFCSVRYFVRDPESRNHITRPKYTISTHHSTLCRVCVCTKLKYIQHHRNTGTTSHTTQRICFFHFIESFFLSQPNQYSARNVPITLENPLSTALHSFIYSCYYLLRHNVKWLFLFVSIGFVFEAISSFGRWFPSLKDEQQKRQFVSIQFIPNFSFFLSFWWNFWILTFFMLNFQLFWFKTFFQLRSFVIHHIFPFFFWLLFFTFALLFHFCLHSLLNIIFNLHFLHHLPHWLRELEIKMRMTFN